MPWRMTGFLALVILSGCSRKPDPSQAATLEKQFEDSLRSVNLVGHFNLNGKESREDSYYIESVSKVGGDTWLFKAKIGKRDIIVPIPITVKWAGDTPVLELTDLSIPGIGTYTARVMFYRNQYAGTWSAKDHGGQMWGRMERAQ
jgi:hypothetical protein